MKKIPFALIWLFTIYSLYVKADNCLYIDSLWQIQKGAVKRNLLHAPSFKGMYRDCFVAFIKRLSENSSEQNFTVRMLSSLRGYCKANNSFDLAILNDVLSIVSPADYVRLSADIVLLWETYNGPFRKKLTYFIERGLFYEADSLYNDMYLLSLLDRYDLLKWTQTKAVLGDYSSAAEVFCDVSLYKKNFVTIARSRFVRLLVEADSRELQRSALKSYKKCYLKNPDADTLSLSKWLSSTYARFKLYREEVNAIIKLDRNAKSKGQRLLTTAQRRFSDNLFPKAIPPALLSWKYLTAGIPRQQCAIVLYQSYAHIGKTDSALIWLGKVNLTNQRSKMSAVVLYQTSGLLDKASGIISTLVESMNKDTLTIRQFLFEGKISNARSFVSKCTGASHWASAGPDTFLWKIRTAVYSGNLRAMALYLDSINSVGFTSSWKYASEILSCRMAMQRLEAYPDAFKHWGHLGYTIYINKPQDPVAGFKADRWPKNIREYLVITLVDALIQSEFFDTAQYILDLVPELNETPQICYFRAHVSSMRGYIEKAKKLFENIILSDPDDVFAHKARIYLLKLKQSQNM